VSPRRSLGLFPSACLVHSLALLVLFAAGSAMAQNRSQVVPVTGTVLDPSRASTSDATVTLKQGSNKVLSSVTTDALGRFRFDAVPDGNYSIEVQHEGFALSVTALRVRTNPPAPLTIVLTLASVVSEVSVRADESAQISTDISENRDAAAADQNLIDKVPVFDQDIVAAMSVFLDAGSVGTEGPQLIVNGVESTGVPVSASAIQEVRINQNPYSADMARPGRGTIEIITKDAVPAYHGTLNFIFRDSSLTPVTRFLSRERPNNAASWRAC
jgi:Carboxypeptidase regulatory-like domain